MLIRGSQVIDRKVAFLSMSRRTFLQIAAHLSLLSATQIISHPLVARAIQTTTQADGYGSGGYGRGVYPGAAPGNHKNYLPIVSKKE